MEKLDAALGWALGNDTGLSSKAIARQMIGLPNERSFHPLDTADFGRCYRLLETIPEWRARIGEMAAVSNEWAALAARWSELEAVYQEDDSGSKLYVLIQSIIYPRRGAALERAERAMMKV